MADYRNLPPVPSVEKPAAFRQSFMRQMDSCPRSAYLGLKYGDGPHSHVLDRGTAVHRVAERMMRDWITAGETYGSSGLLSEMTGALVDEVLDDAPELQLRQSDADAVRAMAYHLAVGLDVPPDRVLGLERAFQTTVEGETLTATVDLLYEIDSETLGIVDYKSGFGVPALDEFEHGFYGFQLRFYSWISTLEFGSYERVRARCLFPRYLDPDGRVRERVIELDKQRLHEFGRDMERLVKRVQRAFSDKYADPAGVASVVVEPGEEFRGFQQWPAVSGDHCTYCPCEPECPLPVHLRQWQGALQSEEQAAETAELADRAKKRVADAQRELRRFIEVNGPLTVGDYVYDLEVSESQGLRKRNGRSDWEGMAEAVANGTFVREEWVKPTATTRLVRVKREVWYRRNETGFAESDGVI
jgi:PD-(D/E)XK nuclease superfamily